MEFFITRTKSFSMKKGNMKIFQLYAISTKGNLGSQDAKKRHTYVLLSEFSYYLIMKLSHFFPAAITHNQRKLRRKRPSE